MRQFFIISILAFACLLGKAEDNFEVTGKFTEAPDGASVLFYYENTEGVKLKVSDEIKDGKFSIKGGIKDPQKILFFFKIDPSSKGTGETRFFFLDKGTTIITGTDKLATATITGGKSQQEYLLLQSKLSPFEKRLDELREEAVKVKAKNDQVAFKKIQDEARPLFAKIDSVERSFVLNHPSSYVSLNLVYLRSRSIKMESFEPLFNALTKKVLECTEGQNVVQSWEKAQVSGLGKIIDFTQTDSEGNPFTLSSLRGKYVLIDFWASWCKHCRDEHPNLKRLYKKYEDENFEIVSVSLDSNKDTWLNAIKYDGISWIQVCDLKGSKNELAVKYGISSVPQSILVDPNGLVITKNLRGEPLNEKLRSIFKY